MIICLLGLPIVAGILCLIVPSKLKGLRESFALITSLIVFALAAFIFLKRPSLSAIGHSLSANLFRLDHLSNFILLAIGLFGFLIALYSLSFMKGKEGLRGYYAYLLWTISGACGAVLANNLILLLVFWGFLGLTLYLLIAIGGPDATHAAKKTFVIVGGSDCLMILGIAIVYYLTGTFQMDKIRIDLSTVHYLLPTMAYLCLAIASFAKAGAMPLHSWIPDSAQAAPQSVVAFLPGALDKLLGIYLLARISLDIFVMNQSMALVLMLIGVITIIASAMMALVQEGMKRLVAYLGISSTGYMLLAIACGNPIGIAGGLFYLISTSIWTSCLFLCAGAVEKNVGTTEFGRVGGLAKVMPITFITALIAGLSVAGVPPFSGFVSKWMVYQGLIELSKTGDKLWIIWLVSAMFGSALILAGFTKVIHTVFLGQPSNGPRSTVHSRREVGPTMWIPMVILALLCVLFGVFAKAIPLNNFILPAVKGVSFLGFWSSGLATLMIIIGIVIGLLIYIIGNVKGMREDTAFVGGEVIPDEYRVTGVDFYDTIKDISPLKGIYKKAEEKVFDIYDQGKRFIFFFTKRLQEIHTGVLTTYLSWCILGFAILIFVLARG